MTSLRVGRNTIFLILRELLNKGTLFILLLLIGRTLGKAALGRYSLAIAISQIFFFGTELGLNTLVIREVAKERLLAGKYLANIGQLRVITGILTLGLIWLTSLVLGAKGETAVVIYLCGLSYLFVNVTNLYTSVFRAFERMGLELLVSLFKNIIFLPIAIWLLFSNQGLVAVFNIFLISNILSLILANIIFMREIGIPPNARPDFVFLKEQLIQTSPLWLSQLFGIAYLKVAPLLLFRLKGEEAVGLYNAGFVVVDWFWIMAGCFVYSLFPVISRLTGPERRKEYLNGLKIVFSASFVLAAVVFLASEKIIPIFFGEKFIEAVFLFKIFAIASVLVVLDTFNGMNIIAIRKQNFLPFINAAGLLANLCLNYFLIARFSYAGSAYAFIISEGLVFVCMALVVKRFLIT